MGLMLWASAVAMTLAQTEPASNADDVPQPVSVAVLGVYEKGTDVKDFGPKIEALLVAALSTRENILLVERAELDKVISELELNLSGMVDPKTANRIGYMTGANVLVSAATFQVDGALYVVAKVIGTESTRVFGVSEKGPMNGLDSLAEALAKDIDDTIAKRRSVLIPPNKPQEDRLAALKAKLGNRALPTLSVSIVERHVGKSTLDPAAQTELNHVLRTLGFTVIDGKTGSANQANLRITGEAMSEFAMQRQNLIGIRARVEINVKNASNKVLISDRQTVSRVGLTEQIASKVALEEAAFDLAERIIPQIIEQWGK